MELWIKSQDRKELLNVNNLAVIGNRIVFINNGNGRATLGTYKSKERALEVLNEIQSCMCNYSFAKKINGLGEEIDLIPNPLLVYNMPKE